MPYVAPGTRFTEIAAGGSHSLTLKGDGTVVAWGNNADGQCTVPAGLSGVVRVAAGEEHSLALRSDGTVAAWGEVWNGSAWVPATVPAGVSGVVAVAAGGSHSLALKSDGSVVAWGDNSYGQSAVPAGLSGLLAVAVGGYHSLALKSDGTVVAWGDNRFGQSTVPAGLRGVAAVAAGERHSLALKRDGTVVAWGANDSGQRAVPSGLSGVVAAAAGGYHSLALKSDGTVVAWGDNSAGESTVPAELSAVAAIAAGGSHSLALKSDGTAAAWGRNQYCQNTVPPGLTGAVAIATGRYDTLALKGDGTVVAWGDDYYGESTVPPGLSGVVAVAAGYYHSLALKSDGTVLLLGDNVSGWDAVPPGLSGVVAVAAGFQYCVALKSDGTVVAWGLNWYGQSTVPAGLSGAVAVAAGEYHSVALKSDGTVAAWGLNNAGQSTVPAGLSGVAAIAAGGSHSLALKSDGTVVAWGDNSHGQSTVPAGLGGVVAVAAGEEHSLALRGDGTIVAWGDNSYGQSAVPAGLSGVVAVAAGGAHSLAIVAVSGQNPASPIVETLTPTSVTATASTLSGSVTPNGPGVTAYFEYGTGLTYGSATAPARLGGNPQTLRYSLTMLTPGTTYHCRLDASNDSGTTLGNDVTFRTSSAPAGSQPAWVSGTGGLGLRLRAAPSLSAAVLLVMPEGSEVTLLGDRQPADGYLWFDAQFGGQTGWAASDYLVLAPPGAGPSAPTFPRQLKPDGITPIPSGGSLNGNSVVLAASAPGPSSQQFSVQFEVRPIGAAFSAPTHQSGFVAGGDQATATVSGLSSQAYHWRARTVDGNGQTSGWLPFGNGASPDFTIDPAALVSALFDRSPTIALAGSPVQFAAQAASQSGLSYQWNFGAGATAASSSVSETFAQAGPVTVTLTVTDAHGNQATSTETVQVASPQLQDAVNKLAQQTSALLDQISSQAHEAAAAADDFQTDMNEAETESVISAAFALINAGTTAGELAGWVGKTFASDAADELVGDAVGDVAERLAKWVAGQLVGSSQTYAIIFAPGIKGFVAQKKAEIEQLRQAAIAACASLGADQAAQLAQALQARFVGNSAISDDYSARASLPVTFDQIKQADESSWSWTAADISFDIGVTAAQAALDLATGGGASGVLGAMVSIDSTMSREALDQATILAGVSMDAQMRATSVGVAGLATISAGLMATNAENGLEDVIQNRAPAVPRGQMSVQPIAQGWLSGFGFSPVWATTKPYAKVTIQNTGTVPASYFVEALYPKTYTTEQLLPLYTGGLFDRDYALNVLSSANPVQLDAAGQQTVEIDFLEIPKGAIMYTLLAVTAGGVYLEAMVPGQFGTTLVDTNGQAIDHSQVPQDLLEDVPVSSTIVEYGNSVSCLLAISVRNPTASLMLLDLRQGLPPGTVAIDAGGGTMGANQLAWDLNLAPGESSLLESALMLPSQSLAFSNTIALAYDEINTAWVQFEAVPAVIQVAQSPPPQLQAIGLTSQGFSLNLQTIAPGVYRVEATTDFKTWAPVATYTNFQSSVNVQDSGAATNTARFYRAVQIQ